MKLESEHHEHSDYYIDTIQIDYWPTPDTDASYNREVYVCGTCGETIDPEVADPELDRVEAKDMWSES